MIGGEGPVDPAWNVEGAWIEYAQENKALAIQVEHRFYGKSHPTPNTSVDNLILLSSDQALADLAYFRENMTETLNTGSAKWISFGGSYSGALSAWLRLKYPHLFFAAMATSAPVQAKLNFVEYAEVVRDSLASNSDACVASVQKATAALEGLVTTTDGRAKLTKQFNLCSDLDSDDRNVSNFAESVAGNIFEVVQYNNELSGNLTIDTICSIMQNESIGDELTRYAAFNSLMLSTYGEDCLDISYSAMIDQLKDITLDDETIGGRMWFYQTCNEFGYFQTTDSKNQPFGSLFSLPFFVNQCIDVFGSQFDQTHIENSITSTNENYGGKNISISRIVFPNGSIDPWHALSITNMTGASYSILINGTAHCANMLPPKPTDIPALQKARLQISEQLKAWIQS
jgi:hypothetical protein